MPGTIRTSPGLIWDSLEAHQVKISPFTPRAGLTTTDYGTLTLTIREDPLYPRAGGDRAALDAGQVDPIADGWPVVETGTVAAGATPTIAVTVPEEGGFNRYTLDVVADGGVAGRVTIVPCTFLSVRPTLKAAS